jgi:hypothetical protein
MDEILDVKNMYKKKFLNLSLLDSIIDLLLFTKRLQFVNSEKLAQYSQEAAIRGHKFI